MPDRQNSLPRVLELFVLAAGFPGPGSGELPTPGGEPLDWEELESQAVFHQVFPLLYKLMEQVDPTLVPAPVRQRLQSLFKANALRNFRLARECLKVLAIFEGTDVDLIPFKGPVLALQSYGDLEMRSFSDIDLLLDHRDFELLVTRLNEKGFKPGFPLSPAMKRYIGSTRRDFRFTGSIGALDFHHRLTQGPSFFDMYERLHRKMVPLKLMDREILAPSVEHSLLAACLHGTKDGWRRLRSILDVALLVKNNPGLNWTALEKDALKAGCMTMVKIGLELARRVTGVTTFVEFTAGSHDKRVQSLARTYLDGLGAGPEGVGKLSQVASLVKSLDTPTQKLHYLAYFSFTPTPVDLQGIPLPSCCYFLYIILRPLRLLAGVLNRIIPAFLKKKAHIGRE